jgi:hypothetical protein
MDEWGSVPNRGSIFLCLGPGQFPRVRVMHMFSPEVKWPGREVNWCARNINIKIMWSLYSMYTPSKLEA